MINLTLSFGYPAGAVSHTATYSRIDNTLNPTTITVPGIITSPATVAENIDNGQYKLTLTPIFPDGRVCQPTTVYTPACPGLISINAYLDGNNIIVQYLAPSEVPKVRINVNYPNGGSTTANYVNNGNDIVIPLPAGVFGDFFITGQSVCDEASGFYSPFSNQVTVTRGDSNVTISNNVTGISINDVLGIDGFTLSSFIPTGGLATGSHVAFFGGITVSFTGLPSVSSSATLKINGTLVQCVNVPSTNGGAIAFNSSSIAASDNIVIEFVAGTCPSSPGGNIFVANQTVTNAATITNVIFPGTTITVPILPGQENGSTHGNFTGQLQLQISSATLSATWKAILFINTTQVDCINIGPDPNGTWSFPSRIYNLLDLIEVNFVDGIC